MSIRAKQQNYEQEHTAQRKLQSGADKRRFYIPELDLRSYAKTY